MLTKLFSSAVRVKILKFLYINPDSFFTIAEISKKVGSIVRTVNKELAKLLEIGAVIEEIKEIEINKKKVKIKHYIVNQGFFLYNEIRDLFFKVQVADLATIKDKVKILGKVHYLTLTGKFVGEINAVVDMLIVGRVSRGKLEKFIDYLEKNLGWEVNYTVMNLEEFEYRQEIHDIFLRNIMDSKKIEIINEIGYN